MFPTLVTIGSLRVATYGVLVASGYLAGVLWLKARRERMGLSEDVFWRLVYALFFGAVIGGKLLFIALNWREYASGRMGLVSDFRYGFVFFGGFLGVAAAGWIFVRSARLPFFKLADYFSAAAPLGHAVGRLGCFAGGCCYGREASVPWAVRYGDPSCLVPQDLLGLPLHPTQLYEAAGNLAVFFAVAGALRRVERGRNREGAAFAAYLALYGVLRFAVEAFRGDDRGGFLLGLSPSQWISLAAVAAAAALAFRRDLPAGAGR